MKLAGNASTNSRGKRPLPPGAVSARTISVNGASELVQFTYADGHTENKSLLSWVGGQSGLLWGGGPYPLEIRDAIKYELHAAQGSYGHAAEWALADALGAALEGVFTSDALSCRFYQSGGEALAAAARLARHARGMNVIASCGYHGASWEWAHEPASHGIPTDTIELHERFDWGDAERLKYLDFEEDLAAICVEVPAVPDAEAITFLKEVRSICDYRGAIFILDEVVTGFRLGLQGAAGRYGVRPDIACYGKAMSATGCVSALVGRSDLVDPIGGEVFYSTTFGGSPGPCAVAAATVRWLTENAYMVYGPRDVPVQYLNDKGETALEETTHFEHGDLYFIGKRLMDGLTALGIPVIGQPERSALAFATDAEWLAFCSAMIEHGVIMHRPQFPTLSHTDAGVARTLEAAAEVVKVMA